MAKFQSSQTIPRVIWGILLTTALMFALAVAAAYASALLFKFDSDVVTLICYIFLSMISIAVAGSLGIRFAHLSWRGTIVAALLFVIGLFLLLSFESTNILFYDDFGNLFIAACGVFLIPLFDPGVRKTGLAPSRWKLVLVALSLTLVTILVDYFFSVDSEFGLVIFLIGTILSIVLVGIGAILVLGNVTFAGAWLGGLGLVLFPFILTAGRLLGGFFPMIAD